jgi:hypothetical protein
MFVSIYTYNLNIALFEAYKNTEIRLKIMLYTKICSHSVSWLR